MTPASHPPHLPSEHEVRSLVARIIDTVLENDAAETGSHPTAEAASSSEPPQPDRPPAPQPQAAPVATPGAIAVGADHGGYPLKERLAYKLREAGHEVIDCGTDSTDSVDYPDFAHAVARKVADGEARSGIIVDGAGIGSAMVANKVPGVRAALCYDLSTARNSREHNHANVLTLGAGLIGDGLAWQIVQEWLAVAWGEGRHANRVGKITDIEQRYLARS